MFNIISAFFTKHSALIVNVTYNILLALGILIISVVFAKFVKKAILSGHKRIKKIDATIIPIISSTVSYLIYLIGAILILDIFGVNTTSIIALLGAAGLAIGFALKDTLSNIAAGLMLLFLRPFKSGDFIKFSTIRGTVKEINLFNTILETSSGIFISSPNSTIWANSIMNYSRNKKRRIEIITTIRDDNISAGLETLQKLLESEKRILKFPAPQTMVDAMGYNSVDVKLHAWAPTNEYWKILWDLNKSIKEEITNAGLTLPHPHSTLEITRQKNTKKVKKNPDNVHET